MFLKTCIENRTEIVEIEGVITALLTIKNEFLYTLYRDDHGTGLEIYSDTFETLIKHAKNAIKPYFQSLFETALDLWTSKIGAKGQRVMFELAKAVDMESVEGLFGLELPMLLPGLLQGCQNWHVQSRNRLSFQALVTESGTAVIDYLSGIIDAVAANIHSDKDEKVRMDMLQVVHGLVKREGLQMSLRPYTQVILRSVLCPVLQWKPGVAGAMVRLFALQCTLELISGEIPEPTAVVMDWEWVFPVLRTCMEDDYDPALRATACNTLLRLLLLCSQDVTATQTTEVCMALRKRMDDSSECVRVAASEALRKAMDIGKKWGVEGK